jgi:hypothetical protein
MEEGMSPSDPRPFDSELVDEPALLLAHDQFVHVENLRLLQQSKRDAAVASSAPLSRSVSPILRAGSSLVRTGAWKAPEFRPHSTFAVQLPAVVGRCPYCNRNIYESDAKKTAKGSPQLCALCGEFLSNRDAEARSKLAESEDGEVAHQVKKDPFVSHVRSGGQVDDNETKHHLQEKRVQVQELSRTWQRNIFKMVSLLEQRRIEAGFGAKPTKDVEEAMKWLTSYDERMRDRIKALKSETVVRISPSQRMLSTAMF